MMTRTASQSHSQPHESPGSGFPVSSLLSSPPNRLDRRRRMRSPCRPASETSVTDESPYVRISHKQSNGKERQEAGFPRRPHLLLLPHTHMQSLIRKGIHDQDCNLPTQTSASLPLCLSCVGRRVPQKGETILLRFSESKLMAKATPFPRSRSRRTV